MHDQHKVVQTEGADSSMGVQTEEARPEGAAAPEGGEFFEGVDIKAVQLNNKDPVHQARNSKRVGHINASSMLRRIK
jgi:hypothetical protein